MEPVLEHIDNHLAVDQEQFLTFSLDNQDYGIPILKVQEIKAWTNVTVLPNSPNYIKGVLNLRGAIVPVIDLRLRFDLEEKEHDAFTVIVIINVEGRLAGIVVDAVSDVISLTTEQHCKTPEFEGQINRQFIQDLAQVAEQLIILLDVDKLVDVDTLDVATKETESDNNTE